MNFLGWAIDSGERGLLGRYGLTDFLQPAIGQKKGFFPALYSVRWSARLRLARLKGVFPRARVVRVEVTVKEVVPDGWILVR